MSVVDVAEQPQAQTPGQMTQAEARRLTDQIQLGLESIWEMAVRAWQGRVWVALGYPSWDDYCTRELGRCRVKLPADLAERAAAWRPLVEAGMSQRAIASVAGVSRERVQAVLSSVERPADRVMGTDGIAQPARKPTKTDVLIRQANAARLRNQGLKQVDIAAQLGVAQATVSADLAQIDKMTSALDEDIDVGGLLDDSRDESGRTDVAAVAECLGVQATPARHLSKLVRQPVKDLEATLRVVVNEVVLADEWLDPVERSAALEVLLPATVTMLGQLCKIVAALPESDRQGQQWDAVTGAIAELERAGGQR